MGTIKFDVPDEVEARFRQWAMKRFGHKRGAIGKAGEEAVSVWVADQDVDLDVRPTQNPIKNKRGALGHVDRSSTDLKHGVGDALLDRHRERRDERE